MWKTNESGEKLMEQWEKSLYKMSEGSRKTYRKCVDGILRWDGISDREGGMSVAELEQYFAARRADGSSPEYVNLMKSAMRSFMRYCEAVKSADNLMADIRNEKTNKLHKRRPYTQEELLQLQRSIAMDTKIGRRDALMVRLMINTGVRCVELSRMDVGDITVEYGRYHAVRIQRKGHTQKDDTIKLIDAIYDEMVDVIEDEDRNNNEPLFISYNHKTNGAHRRLTPHEIQAIINGRLRAAGIKDDKSGPHSLRHSFAVFATLQGVPPDQVQRQLGHRRMTTTEIYKIDADKYRMFSEGSPSDVMAKLLLSE